MAWRLTRRIGAIIASTMYLAVTACVGGLSPPPNAKPFAEVTPPPGYAVLYIYIEKWITLHNASHWDFGTVVTINNHKLPTLPETTYTYIFLKPGEYHIAVGGYPRIYDIDVDADNAYAFGAIGSTIPSGTRWVATGLLALPIAMEPAYDSTIEGHFMKYEYAQYELPKYALISPGQEFLPPAQ